jgi:hypothetical protein
MVSPVFLVTSTNWKYRSDGIFTWNSLGYNSPVLESSNLSSNYLIILKLEGTTPEASPLWTPSFKTVTSMLAITIPLREVVIHKCS